MKRIMMILFFLTLFLFVSCGIPYIYLVENSDYSISHSENITTVRLNSNLQQLTFQEGSPEINLVYVVKPKDYSNNYSSLITAFNSNYSQQTGSIRYTDEPFYKEIDNCNFGVFPLQLSKRLGVESFIDYTCILEFILDEDLQTIDLVLNNDSTNPIHCSRYFNSSTFNGSISNPDGIPFIDNELATEFSDKSNLNGFTIEIYAFISMDIGGTYNNIYNTPVKLVYSFEV